MKFFLARDPHDPASLVAVSTTSVDVVRWDPAHDAFTLLKVVGERDGTPSVAVVGLCRDSATVGLEQALAQVRFDAVPPEVSIEDVPA